MELVTKAKILLPALLLFLWASTPAAARASEITPDGQRLAQVLDSMHVEQLWLSGRQVNWRTGEPNGKIYTNATSHTHCSAFAAAASEKLGVYLLRPPEHSSVLLANAQQGWLSAEGTNQGWYAISSPLKAQQLANQGQLVVVTCKNPDPDLPGHIAIIRPSTKSDDQIRREGPQIIQAGAQNFSSTTVKEGFKHHPGVFEKNQVLYFAHDLSWPAASVQPATADATGATLAPNSPVTTGGGAQ